MASSPVITGAPTRASSFIAKVLAPLPADVPQADDKQFLRLLKVDSSATWRRSLRTCTVAKAHLDYVRAQACLDPTISERQAFAAYVAEIDRQMAVPTIVAEAVTWKRRHVLIGGGQEAIARREALIALDVARMEGR